MPYEFNPRFCNIKYCLKYLLSKQILYNHTGNVQTFTAPSATTYKLEVWGAEGGIGLPSPSSPRGTPGKGGYSHGVKTISANTYIYICVGGVPYNGGGNINGRGGPGGGATHIASTNRGELKNYSSYKSEVYIVAGGGGGVEGEGTVGGNGGGTNGGNSNYNATGGTQTKGGTSVKTSSTDTIINGSFGQGGYGYSTSNDYGGGGGGGWYGGGGVPVSRAGGGGSGYIGGVTNGSTTSGVQSGNGKALITWMPVL